MPKVSVIIPAYNAMAYLPETLESLLKQTYQDYEVVLVNDGSQDNLLTWSQTLTDSRIKVISQDNQGLAGARNTGIRCATGDYLAFLDADDLWAPTKLEKQVSLLDQNPEVGLVYTWVESINAQGKSTGRVFKHQNRGKIWTVLATHNIIECGSNAIVRQTCFKTCGTFDPSLRSYVEDWDMWLRIAQDYEFDVVPEPLVFYRQHTGSASQNWEAMETSFHQVIEKAFAQAPRESQSLKKQALGFAYLCLAWKPLQSQIQNVPQAIAFQRQAKHYNPQLRFSKEMIRLNLAITLRRYLGSKNYNRVLTWGRATRRGVQSPIDFLEINRDA